MMTRPYKIDRFLEIADRLRKKVPGMRLSTDIIVGFPGETLDDFELTKRAFVKAGFEMGFIFKYSDRSGTPSVDLENKVNVSELERRNQELLNILVDQSYASNLQLVGQKMKVLVESVARKGQGKLMGRTSCFRKVNFSGTPEFIGKLINIKITEASPTCLSGELVE